MPDCSNHSRMCSASPQTLQCTHHGTCHRAPTIRWKWNLVHECLVHSGSECNVCKDYLAHLNYGAMKDNGSYIDACNRCLVSYVPIAQWKQDTSELRCFCEDLECNGGCHITGSLRTSFHIGPQFSFYFRFRTLCISSLLTLDYINLES